MTASEVNMKMTHLLVRHICLTILPHTVYKNGNQSISFIPKACPVLILWWYARIEKAFKINANVSLPVIFLSDFQKPKETSTMFSTDSNTYTECRFCKCPDCDIYGAEEHRKQYGDNMCRQAYVSEEELQLEEMKTQFEYL